MNPLPHSELKDILEYYHDKFNNPQFIEHDPICIPHRFQQKEDIEIAGFFAATIAWGKREMIIKNANQLMELMDNQPHDFILNHSKNDLKHFNSFKHRTYNAIDVAYFIEALNHIYTKLGGLESILTASFSIKENITNFHHTFFALPNAPERTRKHVSNPSKGSSSKRLNMYLRWLIRKDKRGVDFGLWKSSPIGSSDLICPLDVHTGNVARKLGLLKRKQNDWNAAEELTNELKKFDPNDPVKYDFALFGAGIHKEIV